VGTATSPGVARADRVPSLWLETCGDDLTPRPGLDGDVDVDIAIVGAGYTGLWTAWYLLRAAPGTRVVVLEREIAGFGASGRNGGWCSALFPASPAALEALHGRDAAVRMRTAMIETVDEVGRAGRAAGVEFDYAKGGTITYARNAAQMRAAHAEVAAAERFGVGELELWTPGDRVLGARGALAATWDPNCARIQPAKLARGLARAVERLGGVILEDTPVTAVVPRRDGVARAVTPRGVVRAEHVVVATEGYTPALEGWRRRLLPLYSLMVATEPLPRAFWDRVGIEHGHTFADYRHLLVYGQRTADDRIAFGGRGALYHFASGVRPEYDRVERIFRHLRRAIDDLFPDAAGAAITHAWGGPLGVSRDWHASVGMNAPSGIAWAGGYVGDGVATTNLAGRTLRDLLLGRSTGLTALPWVGHRSRDWEPEPLRFLGANLGLLAVAAADVEERLTGRSSLAARLMGPWIGH